MRSRLAHAIGYILFVPPAVLCHAFWFLWGMLAYPIGLMCGKTEETVHLMLSIQIGPTYASSRLFKTWAYYGCEPEVTDAPVVQPTRSVEIDLAFAPVRPAAMAENMRGDESRPMGWPH